MREGPLVAKGERVWWPERDGQRNRGMGGECDGQRERERGRETGMEIRECGVLRDEGQKSREMGRESVVGRENLVEKPGEERRECFGYARECCGQKRRIHKQSEGDWIGCGRRMFEKDRWSRNSGW